jgi:hypothetical protein
VVATLKDAVQRLIALVEKDGIRLTEANREEIRKIVGFEHAVLSSMKPDDKPLR